MDDIIRYYWICWDNHDGTDDEKIIRDRAAAFHFFETLPADYKKLVACYNDHDETLQTVSRII